MTTTASEMARPSWFNPHGQRVWRINKPPKHRHLTLNSNTVEIRITQKGQPQLREWRVEWDIAYASYDDIVSGHVIMTTEQLEAAFGVTNNTSPHRGMLDRYGAYCAWPRKFVRRGDYLNLSRPGTQHKGDRNASIIINQHVSAAARQLAS